jgi:hypothetical protein
MLLEVDVPVQPPGRVQVYASTPGVLTTLYISVEASHKVVVPVIVLGAAGTVIATTEVDDVPEVPQLLLAVTAMFPDPLTVPVSEFDVEDPVKLGAVQLYVTPGVLVTE